jgi:hypothetical protein
MKKISFEVFLSTNKNGVIEMDLLNLTASSYDSSKSLVDDPIPFQNEASSSTSFYQFPPTHFESELVLLKKTNEKYSSHTNGFPLNGDKTFDKEVVFIENKDREAEKQKKEPLDNNNNNNNNNSKNDNNNNNNNNSNNNNSNNNNNKNNNNGNNNEEFSIEKMLDEIFGLTADNNNNNSNSNSNNNNNNNNNNGNDNSHLELIPKISFDMKSCIENFEKTKLSQLNHLSQSVKSSGIPVQANLYGYQIKENYNIFAQQQLAMAKLTQKPPQKINKRNKNKDRLEVDIENITPLSEDENENKINNNNNNNSNNNNNNNNNNENAVEEYKNEEIAEEDEVLKALREMEEEEEKEKEREGKLKEEREREEKEKKKKRKEKQKNKRKKR